MDIKFEKVEEGVGDGVDGAVYAALDSILQLQRLVGFRAGGEGNVLEVVGGVLDVFAGLTVSIVNRDSHIQDRSNGGHKEADTYIDRFRQVTGILAP
jgi:hypothetical protein